MAKINPFIPPGKDYGAVDTESRLRALEDFNLEQCHAALEVLGLQATVEKKLRIRIRALEKLASPSVCADSEKPSSALELERPEVIGYACLDDIQWGGDITLRPERSEHYSVPFAPVAQAGQVPDIHEILRLVELLGEVACAAFRAADDSEERQRQIDGEIEHMVDEANFRALCAALDACDEEPGIDDVYFRDGWLTVLDKLRKLLASAPQPAKEE